MSMMAQYDKNKNGQLEREEWSRMRGRPKEADRNGDDVLSLDELTVHLAAYGSRRDAPAGSRSGAGGKASYRSKKPDGTRRTYRFLSPHERLPKELRDWFVRKDADLDGQVSMAEFSTVWQSDKLGEFANLDLNGDGLIVPKEYLRATTEQ
jgi:Ca2+-binding EF-hand superfamily protein